MNTETKLLRDNNIKGVDVKPIGAGALLLTSEHHWKLTTAVNFLLRHGRRVNVDASEGIKASGFYEAEMQTVLPARSVTVPAADTEQTSNGNKLYNAWYHTLTPEEQRDVNTYLSGLKVEA